jgi:hypothetical protein
MFDVVVAENSLFTALIPAIIEAWFSSSEKMTQPGSSLPSVESAASFDT